MCFHWNYMRKRQTDRQTDRQTGREGLREKEGRMSCWHLWVPEFDSISLMTEITQGALRNWEKKKGKCCVDMFNSQDLGESLWCQRETETLCRRESIEKQRKKEGQMFCWHVWLSRFGWISLMTERERDMETDREKETQTERRRESRERAHTTSSRIRVDFATFTRRGRGWRWGWRTTRVGWREVIQISVAAPHHRQNFLQLLPQSVHHNLKQNEESSLIAASHGQNLVVSDYKTSFLRWV